jgi:hypothetical protein
VIAARHRSRSSAIRRRGELLKEIPAKSRGGVVPPQHSSPPLSVISPAVGLADKAFLLSLYLCFSVSLLLCISASLYL